MSAPFMVAVCGGSGSGKTTFVRKLWNRLETHRPLVLTLDHYYKDLSHLDPDERAQKNFDDPESIERDLVHEQVSLLRNGVAVDRPTYDFATHTRTAVTERLQPSSVIIMDGIFSLCYPEIRKLLDLKIFIDVDDDVRVLRRIRRDMAERGRNFESCANQYLASVKTMHREHAAPTRAYADLVIPWHDVNERAVEFVAGYVSNNLNP